MYKNDDILVGYPVRLKSFHEDFRDNDLGVDDDMIPFFGQTVTVKRLESCYTDNQWFSIEEDNGMWTWTSDWIVEKVEIKLPEELFRVV